MIVQCEGCQTRFKVPEDRLSGPQTRVRCSRCGVVFTVAAPTAEPAGPAPPSPAPPRTPTAGPGLPRTPTPPVNAARTPRPAPGVPLVPAPAPQPTAPADDDPFAHLDLGNVAAEPAVQIEGSPGAPAGPPPLSEDALPAFGGMELETFAGDARSGRPSAPAAREGQRPSGQPGAARSVSHPLSPAAHDGSAGGGSNDALAGRMIAFDDALPGIDQVMLAGDPPLRPAGPATPLPSLGASDPGRLRLPNEGRRLQGARSPLPPTRPSERAATPSPGPPGRSVSAPPLAAVAGGGPALRMLPPLGNGALTVGLALLLLLDGLTLFLAARNGWQLDLRQPGRMLAVAFGQARPLRSVTTDGPVQLVNVRHALYATDSGQDLVVGEGELVNSGPTPLRRVRIDVRLIDGASEKVLDAREVPGGSWLQPAVLRTLRDRASVDRAYLELEREGETLTIQPGERAPFIAVFPPLAAGRLVEELALEVKVTELREASGGQP